jgi:hypothetical protein
MTSDDLNYFRERAAVERAMARAAADSAAAAVHDELARGYEVLVRREEMRLTVRIVSSDQDQRSATG